MLNLYQCKQAPISSVSNGTETKNDIVTLHEEANLMVY